MRKLPLFSYTKGRISPSLQTPPYSEDQVQFATIIFCCSLENQDELKTEFGVVPSCRGVSTTVRGLGDKEGNLHFSLIQNER